METSGQRVKSLSRAEVSRASWFHLGLGIWCHRDSPFPVFLTYVYVCMDACEGQKRMMDPLELEFPVAVGCPT